VLRNSERPQSLQQVEPILETLNDNAVISDDSDQILSANAVFEEITGIPRSEIIGHNTRNLYDRAEEFALPREFNQKVLEMGRKREEFFYSGRVVGDSPSGSVCA
jgi:PAS domain S-box-containing protein